jgi:hypothetical protein
MFLNIYKKMEGKKYIIPPIWETQMRMHHDYLVGPLTGESCITLIRTTKNGKKHIKTIEGSLIRYKREMKEWNKFITSDNSRYIGNMTSIAKAKLQEDTMQLINLSRYHKSERTPEMQEKLNELFYILKNR